MLLRYSPAARCKHEVNCDPNSVSKRERDIQGFYKAAWAIY